MHFFAVSRSIFIFAVKLNPMNLMRNYIILLLCIASLVACKNEKNMSSSEDLVKWHDIKAGLDLPNPDGKKYLVSIETDSCKWCAIMNEKTYTFPALAEYINENFIPVKFNTLTKDSLSFKGEMYGPKKIGLLPIHGLADKWLNYWYYYPTVIIFDKDFNQLVKFSGYKDPDQFLLELKKM
jgi:thioredoxin-related protein